MKILMYIRFMKTTKLILTEENKNYLIAFLGELYIHRLHKLNDTSKQKLVEIIDKLVPDDEDGMKRIKLD